MRKLLFCLLALVLSPAVQAGLCVDAMRPLLLESEPDPAVIEDIRAACESEAVAGDAVALYQLALFHLGLGGEWQPEAATPLIHEAAAAGVSEAQYWLAWQYEEGPLLEHDQTVALSWYQRAANADHRLALARLAHAYEAGELGLAPDRLKALEYQARAARCAAQDAAAVPQAATDS